MPADPYDTSPAYLTEVALNLTNKVLGSGPATKELTLETYKDILKEVAQAHKETFGG